MVNNIPETALLPYCLPCGTPPSTTPPLSHSTNWTQERDCVGQLTVHPNRVTLSSSPPTTSATNMCVGGLLGSHMPFHVRSTITRMVVRTPLTMPMCLDCQSHTDLRMNATIFGHMPEATRKGYHMTATVPVRLTQESAHRHLWGRTFTVNLLLTTLVLPTTTFDPIPILSTFIDGTPTTHSGTEETASLEVVAATMLLLHGLGGHSRRIPQRT